MIRDVVVFVAAVATAVACYFDKFACWIVAALILWAIVIIDSLPESVREPDEEWRQP